MRYLKATLICGAATAFLVILLFELHAFARLDVALANFLGFSLPPAIGRGLQYFLVLLLSFGTAWTTIDLDSVPLKLGIAFAAIAETVTAAWVANLHGAYFSPFASIAAIVLSASAAFWFSQTHAGRRKRTIQQILGDRVSKGTFARIVDGNMPINFGGDLREATVLVCEIINHEELLSTLRTDNYVEMTNSFLENAADFLVERGAYLDECDGESLRVVFGALLPEPEHASIACESCLDLAGRLESLNRECLDRWGKVFDWRIGINSGEVILAAYGSRRLGALSVSGEPVEFARRLCSANSIYGTRTLIGARTFALAEEAVEVRPMELIQRHPDNPSREEVYELIAHKDQLSEPQRARRDLFWKGVVYFRENLLDRALVTFMETREKYGADGAVDFYIRRIEQMQQGLPVLGWGNSRL